MGGRDFSSKRKSSKRKRDKTSSQKKSQRNESRMRSRVHDSVSSYSDDSSSDSGHTSSSTSESDHRRMIHKSKKLRRDYSTSSSSRHQSMSSDSEASLKDYKRKKARRSRLNLKSNKKRARQRSVRPKGDGGAHSGEKRKRSSRDGVAKPKKKLSSKKKPKRHSSTSSSSDSESCSTCKSNSSSSTADRKRRKSKIILNNERERPRGRETHTSLEKRKIRSPSCPSCDRDGKHIDGALPPVNNNISRRLKSVIAVVDQQYDEGEENRCERDPHKEEIVYDKNDYPSPKSLDSYEEGTKVELDNQSQGASSKIILVENVAVEAEVGKSEINEGNKDNDGDRQLNAVDADTLGKGKETDTSVPVASLGGDVLESILRQKALENLKKFKGRLQTCRTSTNNMKINNPSNVNKLSNIMVGNVQNKSTKVEGNSDVREVNQNSGLLRKCDLSQLSEVKKVSDSENVEKMNRDSGLTEKGHIFQLKEVKKRSDSENVEKESGTATLISEHPIDRAEILECSKVDKYVGPNAVLPEPMSRTDTCPGAESTKAGSNSIMEASSSVGPTIEERSLERGNEGKDGSQFEQKTMSVMRGGEMVQVSYKVYIPKKAPALAKRPLRR